MAQRAPDLDEPGGTSDSTGGPGDRVDDQPSGVIETHLSRVFLTPDRVYKLLKPVTTSFVDLAPTDDRLAAAAREYELNSRISPDVYLGTGEVDEDGQLTDRFIVMRRLPADRQLDRLIGAPDFLEHVREVARLIASTHAGQPPERGRAAVGATREALARNWQDNFQVLEPLVGTAIPAEDHRLARDLVERFLAGREALFRERIEQGWIRDGHGDLRAEHVFCLDDGPRLIDCLAFRDDLRVADVLIDLAFLAMDLHRLSGPPAALWLVKHYDEFSAERHPASLAHHYVAYRAHVRAKVAAIRFGQGIEEAAQEAADYHRLALRHLLVGQPRLVLIGGGAGVGKSTVAAGLSDVLGMTWLRSDEIRKNLAGMAVNEHAYEKPDEGIYRPEFSDRVIREMLREAELLLERGESVVLDATWAEERRREWARDLAARTSSNLTEILCDTPLAVAKERVARRMASLDEPSDATPDIVEHVAASFEPWPAAQVVDTTLVIADSVAEACDRIVCDRIDRDPSAGRPGEGPPARIDEEILGWETVEFFLSRVSTWRQRWVGERWVDR
jgi:aminoglycoside phosphotransferase family enzyme/predicted kinase